MFNLESLFSNKKQWSELILVISSLMNKYNISDLKLIPNNSQNEYFWKNIKDYIKNQYKTIDEKETNNCAKLLYSWWCRDQRQFCTLIKSKIKSCLNKSDDINNVCFTEKITFDEWFGYKNKYKTCNKRPRLGKSFFQDYVDNIINKKLNCNEFNMIYNGFSLQNKIWKSTLCCKKCNCNVFLVIDETKRDEDILDLNISFENPKCSKLQVNYEEKILNSEVEKIELFSKKKNKFIDSKTLITMVKTETTQLLSKSLISESVKIKGFVHESSLYPYGFLLLSSIQAEAWEIIQEENSIWYFGFNTRILTKLLKQERSAFYSMVAFDKSNGKAFPVFDFTAQFNKKNEIVKYLNYASFYLSKHFPNHNDLLLRKWKIAPVIVTFYSAVAIESLIYSFNYRNNLCSYINWTYKILTNKSFLDGNNFQNLNTSIIYICAENFLDLFIYKLRNLAEINKNLDKEMMLFITNCIALIQNCESLNQVENYILHIQNIFKSSKRTMSVINSLKFIQEKIIEKKVNYLKISNLIMDDFQYKKETAKDPLTEFYNENIFLIDSDYLRHFKLHLSRYEPKEISIEKKAIENENKYYNLECFETFFCFFSILPLWSGIMLNHIQTRFPLLNISKDSNFLTIKPFFIYSSILTNHILLNGKKIVISDFVANLYPELKRIFNKYFNIKKKFKDTEHLKDKGSKKKFCNQLEKWRGAGSKTKHKKNFSYYTSQLGYKDFTIDEMFRYDFLGLMNKTQINYCFKTDSNNFSIFKNEIIGKTMQNIAKKNEPGSKKIRRKYLKILHNLDFYKRKKETLLNNFKFKFQKNTLKYIFEQVSDQKDLEIVFRIFNQHYHFLNESVKKLRKLNELSFTNIKDSFSKLIFNSRDFENELFHPVNSEPDGNCLYNSFSLLLFGNESMYFVFKILSMFILYINFGKLQTEFKEKNLNIFIKQSLKTKEWGNEFNILLISLLLDYPIYVFTLDEKENIAFINTYLHYLITDKNPLILAFYYLNNNIKSGHFCPIFKKSRNRNDFFIFEQNYVLHDYPDKCFKIFID